MFLILDLTPPLPSAAFFGVYLCCHSSAGILVLAWYGGGGQGVPVAAPHDGWCMHWCPKEMLSSVIFFGAELLKAFHTPPPPKEIK